MLLRVLIASAVCLCCYGYVIKPTSVTVVSDSSKARLWKPTHAVTITEGIGAFKLSVSSEDCMRISEKQEKECSIGAYTLDGGASFQTYAENEFCAAGGVVNENSLRCLSKMIDDEVDDVFSFSTTEFKFTEEGIEHQEVGVTTFDHPGYAEPQASRSGEAVATFPEKNLMFRNMELTVQNESDATISDIHALYKSNDDGGHWEFVSKIPFPMGENSMLTRVGETKLMLVTGRPGNYTQATSIYLGSRWEKISNVSYAAPLSSYISPYRTTIFGGVRGRPGIFGMAQGSRKGSEKTLNFASFHNRLLGKLESAGEEHSMKNFSDSFLNATSYDCEDAENDHGCQSSSHVALLSFGNDTVVAIYDMLSPRFRSPREDPSSTIYAMKLKLNETKEMKEAEEREAERIKREAQEKIYAEQRKKAQQEADQRKREKKREKQRLNRERRETFAMADVTNMEMAKENMKVDGELIVVREVDPDLVDIEKDTF